MAHTPWNERPAYARAAALKAKAPAAYQAVRSSRDYSTAGRQRQMAASVVATGDRLAEALQSDDQSVSDRADQLSASLFRPPRVGRTPGTTELERDSMQRCAAITSPADARAMLTAASQLGDTSLARAAARRAADLFDQSAGNTIDRGRWRDVLDEWAGSSLAPTGARADLTELLDIDAETRDPLLQIARQQHYRPAVPPELTGQAHRIPQLAAQANQTGDQRTPTHTERVGQRLAARAVVD
jgi:hypothetical protein